jgi:hypothetical protein
MKYTWLVFQLFFPLQVAAQVVAGSNPDVPDLVGTPIIEIKIYQADGGVIFEFFVPDRWWTGKSSTVRVPYEVGAMMVANKEGQIIWDIGFKDASIGVNQVKYGLVPKEFKQRIPVNGNAPALQPTKEYRVIAYSGGGGEATFVYQGSK